MISRLKNAIKHLPEDHVFHNLSDWHLKQMIKQMKLRSVSPRLKPYRDEEIYKGQGRMITELYVYLTNNKTEDMVSYLNNCSIEDIRKLMWQRFTEDSTIDLTTLPPTRADIVERLSDNDFISAVQKELKRVTEECPEDYWNLVIEEIEEKVSRNLDTQELIREVIDFFLDEFTWWNTFESEDGSIYFEIRDRTGHGFKIQLPDLDKLVFIEP